MTNKRVPASAHRLTHALVAPTLVPALVAAGALGSVMGIASFGGAPMGHAAVGPATPDVRVAAGTRVIKDSYIIVLKDMRALTRTQATATARRLTGRRGGRLTRTYGKVLPGFAVKASATEARRLAADPEVAYVEQDAVLSVTDTQPGATWGLDRLDQRKLPLSGTYRYDTSGAGVTAYVIDTGIRTSHADFGGRARVGTDTVGDGRNGQDGNGHGTHVAGTIGGARYGVAKGVDLVAVRVLDDEGSGSTSGVIGGVDWVTQNAAKPAVANMSLGGGVSQALDDAVRRSIGAGVTYAIAAGNSTANACYSSPARTSEAITVGATGPTDARAAFSNYGTCLDLFAPGVGITSAHSSGDTATAAMSGTSMAAPHAAGTAALYLAGHPAATPAAVRNALVSSAGTGQVGNAGGGSPTKLLHSLGNTPQIPAPMRSSFQNATNVRFAWKRPVAVSTIRVTGRTGRASRQLRVGVNVKYPKRGALKVLLTSPNGRTVVLKGWLKRDRARNLNVTFTVNASAVQAYGTWRLRVYGLRSVRSNGYIDAWSLRF